MLFFFSHNLGKSDRSTVAKFFDHQRPCIIQLALKRPVKFHIMQFLTNAFMVPYMALRERLPENIADKKLEKPRPLPSYSKLLGGLAIFIAGVSAVWLFKGRPEYGGLDVRWEFAVEQFNGNRAFWAFVLDLAFYSVWQAFLMEDCGAPKKFRYIPFFGLASWLIVGGSSLKKGLQTGFWDPEDKWVKKVHIDTI